jgi:hypothetical protein
MGTRSVQFGVLVGVAVATALALVPGVARATVSSTYRVSGVEYSATSAEGKFVGYAVGSSGDAALWNADVRHEALSASCYLSGCVVLPGGSIALVTSGGDSVGGSFTGGSITFVRQDSGCAKQIFHVVGEVATSFGDGTATFDVALTHYRKSIFGVCVTYSATVGPDTTDGIPGALTF